MRARVALGVAVAVVVATALAFGSGRALFASAGDYGYPYPNAPDCDEQTGSHCVTDQWGFVEGQCMSWVAYRLNQLNAAELEHVSFDTFYDQPPQQRWGNAIDWAAAAIRAGITIDDTPAVGSVAWWSTDGGHVAYVEAVDGDTVQVSEMNFDYHNGFRFATLQRGVRWPNGFIHIADRAPSPSTTSTSTTTTSTTTPPTTKPPKHRPPRPPVSSSASRSRAGYWMLSRDGGVYAFGAAPFRGRVQGTADATHIVASTRNGYYVLAGNAVHAFGAAPRIATPKLSLLPGERVTTMSLFDTRGSGYWLFTSRGRAFAVGRGAPGRFHGDLRHVTLAGPILGSVATPTGRGYYMVASDGGVFAFGDARFYGSMGGRKLNRPIVGLVPAADNQGYWLVASDGGVFAFGSARFRGSMGNVPLAQPIVGMVRYGHGYLMVAADGGVFDFSDLGFAGSLGNHPPASPVVAIAAP